MPKKLTQEEFENKIKEVHGDRINIDKVKYVNSSTPIHVKCNICSYEWDVKPNTLFNGHGCRKCYDKKNSDSRRQDIETINKRIVESGNNKLEVIGEYIDTKHPALIRCKSCGHVWRSNPGMCYRTTDGCPSCGKIKNTNEFIKNCKEKYGDIYDFSMTIFKGKRKNVNVICKKHGNFEVKAASLLGKTKRDLCPKCAEEIKDEKRRQIEELIIERKNKKEETERKKNENKRKINRVTDTEKFISKLKTVFKDGDYDFSKTVFNGSKNNATIHCNKHNIDITKPASVLLMGYGCHLCKRSGHKFSSDDWRILAREKYPDFDYSDVDYKNKSTKVKVICHKTDEDGKEHGVFEVRPNAFLRGEETCPKCRKEKELLDKGSIFKEKINNIYKNYNYDFSNVKYYNVATPIEVRCNKHNLTWFPLPNNMLRHHTLCPECAKEIASEKSRLSYSEIIERLNNLHPDLDFSLFKEQPKNTNEKITVICHNIDNNGTEHGTFKKTIHSLLNGEGCPVCGRIKAGLNSRITQEEFLKNIKQVHKGKKFDFSKVNYVKSDEYVTVICKETDMNGHEHGEFKITASALANGQGCPKCRMSHLEQSVRVFMIDNNEKFIHQKKFVWLKCQTLDFYLPCYNIAIECQGSQHFIPDFFKSKGVDYSIELLKKVQERDARKKRLCKKNNVKLIYFLDKKFVKYLSDDDIYFTNLDEMLEYIRKQPKV